MLTLHEVSAKYGIPYQRIVNRKNSGMTVEQAVNMHVKETAQFSIDGVSRTVSEWEQISGIPANVIYTRITRGYDVATAVFKPLDNTCQTFNTSLGIRSYAELSELTGISEHLLRTRIRRGYTIE